MQLRTELCAADEVVELDIALSAFHILRGQVFLVVTSAGPSSIKRVTSLEGAWITISAWIVHNAL